jgi:hypothetical protein
LLGFQPPDKRATTVQGPFRSLVRRKPQHYGFPFLKFRSRSALIPKPRKAKPAKRMLRGEVNRLPIDTCAFS